MREDDGGSGHRLLLLVTVTLYGIICGAGAVGNTVVVAVIVLSCALRSTVTNIYIMNLAVSDFCFLAGLPLLIVTALRQVRHLSLQGNATDERRFLRLSRAHIAVFHLI